MIVLLRRPESWTDAFAGRMGHVFGTHEEALRYLAAERQDWGTNGSVNVASSLFDAALEPPIVYCR